MVLPLCPQTVFQLKLLNSCSISGRKPAVIVDLPVSLSVWSSPSFPGWQTCCPGPDSYRSFQRWMSSIVTCQSGPPIPLFIFPFFLLLFLSSWNLWEWWHVWSDSYFSRQSCGQREWQAPVHCEVGHWDLTGCAVFVGGDAPWCVVTMPSAYIMKCRGLLFFSVWELAWSPDPPCLLAILDNLFQSFFGSRVP